MKIKVNSEIGKLKSVLVHRPGKEVERLYPEIFERLLFDDIMYLEKAQAEHDEFVKKLENEGIEVLYIEKLVGEILDKEPELRNQLIDDFITESKVTNQSIITSVKEFFSNIKNNLELVRALIAGIEKKEVNPKFDKNSLSDHTTIDSDYPFYIDPIPNILFQRDPIASIFDGMNLNKMWSVTRRREAIFYRYLLKHHPDFKSDVKTIFNENDYGSIEGGDILVINKETIFVGLSERTNAQAIECLAKKLFDRYADFKRVVAIEIPKSHATMHLDTVMTQMDHDKFSIDADMLELKYNMFEITKENQSIKVSKKNVMIEQLLKEYVHKDIILFPVGGGDVVRSKREQWNDGANCLCIRPGVIVVYDRNKITNELVKKGGIKVIEVPSSELSRGRGGPRCMSMPLVREEI